MRFFLVVIYCLTGFLPVLAQDLTLSIKHKTTGSVYEVDPERAVKYRLTEGSTKRGFIQSLTDEAMVVNGETVSFDDIVMLSSWHTRKNSSAKTGGILLTGLGGILTTAGVVIIVESVKEDDVGTVVGVPFGAATTAVGLGTTYLGLRALKRKRFDMMDWDIIIRNY